MPKATGSSTWSTKMSSHLVAVLAANRLNIPLNNAYTTRATTMLPTKKPKAWAHSNRGLPKNTVSVKNSMPKLRTNPVWDLHETGIFAA